MKTTIKDISRETGLSASTISRVLTGNGYVKEETRRRIEDAIQKLNYTSLQSSRKNILEKALIVIVDDITNQFYVDIIRGIESIFEPMNYKVLICKSDDNNIKEENYLAFASSSGFSGAVMVTARETPRLVKILDQADMPVVMVNRYLRSYDCDSVSMDNYRGGYMSVQYLLEMGHSKISHLSGPMHSSASSDRYRGFIDAMHDNKLEVTPDMLYNGNLHRDKGIEYAEYFVNNKLDFTAVFCCNDIMAQAFIERLTSLGKRVPEDVSVISFDETQISVLGEINITNISKNPYDMGQCAAQILSERIQNPNLEIRKIVLPPQLNIRNSVRNLTNER